MLVLSRKTNESIVIGDDVVIRVLSVTRGAVKLGVTAPDNVQIVRTEIVDIHVPPS